MTPASFTMDAGAALRANFTCSPSGRDLTSFTVEGFLAASMSDAHENPIITESMVTRPRWILSCMEVPPSLSDGRPLLLLRHNLILDPVVGRLWDHLLLDQFILPLLGSMLNDLLGVRIPDPRQSFELFLSGSVEVERFGFFGGDREGRTRDEGRCHAADQQQPKPKGQETDSCHADPPQLVVNFSRGCVPKRLESKSKSSPCQLQRKSRCALSSFANHQAHSFSFNERDERLTMPWLRTILKVVLI